MTCPHFLKKILVNFLTSTLLRAQNTTLLSKVRQRFFSNFVAFSENPNFILKTLGTSYCIPVHSASFSEAVDVKE